jgi:hypothetical protein
MLSSNLLYVLDCGRLLAQAALENEKIGSDEGIAWALFRRGGSLP